MLIRLHGMHAQGRTVQVSTTRVLSEHKGRRSTGIEAKGERGCLAKLPPDQASAAGPDVLDMFHMLGRLNTSPGHGVPPVTWWGTESRAPALRSAACWAASAQVGEPRRQTLRLRAALHQALRRSGGQPHLQAMALH